MFLIPVNAYFVLFCFFLVCISFPPLNYCNKSVHKHTRPVRNAAAAWCCQVSFSSWHLIFGFGFWAFCRDALHSLIPGRDFKICYFLTGVLGWRVEKCQGRRWLFHNWVRLSGRFCIHPLALTGRERPGVQCCDARGPWGQYCTGF